MRKPPPFMMGCRVTEFAVRDRSIPRQRRTLLFVNSKELGTVPRFALGQDRKSGDFCLFHCGTKWNIRGTSVSESPVELKSSLERIYPGIAKKWRRTGYSRKQSEAFRRRIWAGLECSFCHRFPDDFESMIESRKTRICDRCIREFAAIIDRQAPGAPKPVS